MGLLRFVRFVVIIGLLAAGATALWQRRESVKQVWESVGGGDGLKLSAGRLVESAGPVKDFVTRVANLK